MLEIVCKRFHIYGIIIFTFRKEQNKNLVKTPGFSLLTYLEQNPGDFFLLNLILLVYFLIFTKIPSTQTNLSHVSIYLLPDRFRIQIIIYLRFSTDDNDDLPAARVEVKLRILVSIQLYPPVLTGQLRIKIA